MVHTVRVVLGLQTESGVLRVRDALRRQVSAVKEVPAVELKSLKRCEGLQSSSREGILDCGNWFRKVRFSGENHAVIVPAGLLQVPADRLRAREVEGCTFALQNGTGRNEFSIDLKVPVTGKAQTVIEDGSRPCKIEICVVGKVQRSPAVAGCQIINPQSSLRRE